MPKANCTFRIADVKRFMKAVADAGVKIDRLEYELPGGGKISVIPSSENMDKPDNQSELDRELADFEAHRA